MHAFHTISDARRQLDWVFTNRLHKNPIFDPIEKVRFPIGLFFIRGDRAGAAKDLIEQVVASYDYWNGESGLFLDIVLPGWGNDSGLIDFNSEMFRAYKNEIESISRWRSSGETEILLLNYDYKFTRWDGPQSFWGVGDFAFDETICLPVEQMARDGRIGSMDGFMQELFNSAKEHPHRTNESSLWIIRDKIALQRGLNATWQGLLEATLKSFSGLYQTIRPFQITNLQTRSGTS